MKRLIQLYQMGRGLPLLLATCLEFGLLIVVRETELLICTLNNNSAYFAMGCGAHCILSSFIDREQLLAGFFATL